MGFRLGGPRRTFWSHNQHKLRSFDQFFCCSKKLFLLFCINFEAFLVKCFSDPGDTFQIGSRGSGRRVNALRIGKCPMKIVKDSGPGFLFS